MSGFLIVLIIDIVALMIVAKLFTGIVVRNAGALIVAALLIAIVNAFLKPILLALTLPINILTLGILTLFINGFLFWLVAKIVPGFEIQNYWKAFWGALVFSIISVLLNLLIGTV